MSCSESLGAPEPCSCDQGVAAQGLARVDFGVVLLQVRLPHRPGGETVEPLSPQPPGHGFRSVPGEEFLDPAIQWPHVPGVTTSSRLTQRQFEPGVLDVGIQHVAAQGFAVS